MEIPEVDISASASIQSAA